ncbi:hypothetical protein [Thalassotalea aquiviva]|uniref:hypothetical protein n=1 Tax=Thalassotalea aquiviva TaxID=3242415 RepID=UPI00352A4AE7
MQPPLLPLAHGANASLPLTTLKSDMLTLGRKLIEVEQDLLYPQSSRLVLYLSNQAPAQIDLYHIKVVIDGIPVFEKSFYDQEVVALDNGGAQRFFIGNVASGEHLITVFFSGTQNERTIKRGLKAQFKKTKYEKLLHLQAFENDSDLLEFVIREV